MKFGKFLIRLGRHGRSIGIVAGILAALLVLITGMAAIVASERAQLANAQGKSGKLLSDISAEISQIHARLQHDFKADCSDASLTRLRTLLLQYRYIRTIGILDADGRISCNTSHGRFSEPETLPPADLINPDQMRSWMNYPLKTEDTTLRVSLSSQGPFVTMIDSHTTSDTLRHSSLDALWLNHHANQEGEAQLVWTLMADRNTLLRPANTQFRYTDEQHYWSRLDWQNARLIVGSNVPNTGFFIQNYLGWAAIASKNAYLLAGLVLLAAIIGTLAGVLTTQRLRYYTTLEYRIGELCRPEHIICMYQPIVELASGRIVGCEVLMRLQDGDEVIFPDRVIPLIMEKKLGWALDSAVSERALRDLAAALPATMDAPPFKVALNFFPENIRHEQLHKLLQPLQNDHIAINVEVTEYGMSDDLFDDVARLRSDRYLISVDDFGTGYSNLGTVKRLSPDFLKIDRSFVFDMEDASLRSSLIPEIVAIASAVEADIIAEGVENEKQAGLLKRLGVRYGQGYWFSRPVPLAAFLQMLAEPPKIIGDVHVAT